MHRTFSILFALALGACAPIATQTTSTMPASRDSNAITLAASVQTSWFWGTASDVTILLNGEPVIHGDWAGSKLSGTYKGRNAWAKCDSRINLLRNIGREIFCTVYIDGTQIGVVSATEE